MKIWFIANKNWGNKSIHIKPMIMKEISTAFEYSISKAIEKTETARKDQQSGSEVVLPRQQTNVSQFGDERDKNIHQIIIVFSPFYGCMDLF